MTRVFWRTIVENDILLTFELAGRQAGRLIAKGELEMKQNELKDLADGLSYAMNRIFDSSECKQHMVCNTGCKAYAICHDLCSAREYILKKIKEREAFELHRDTKESK